MTKIIPLLQLMRPAQWIKNGFVFMPLIFSTRLWEPALFIKSTGMFIAFCFASSATYILNDYADIERDKAHPIKKKRPLAQGIIAPHEALIAMLLLLVATFAIAVAVQASHFALMFIAAYLILQISYSFYFKNIVIVDVMVISTGFLLRVLVGATVPEMGVSSWLILCTFSVAILLALGKRRHEIVILNDDAVNHRPVLENYSVLLLDQLVQLATTSTFIFYCLYSVTGNPAIGVEPQEMMFTIPLVAYGIFRYLWLVHHKDEGGSPTALLLADPPLLACTIIWLVTCLLIIYV